MFTLRQRYPEAYQSLIQDGYRAIPDMLGRFATYPEMEHALRVSSWCVKRWLIGVHKPQERFEKRAQHWLRENPVLPQTPVQAPAQATLDLKDKTPVHHTPKVADNEWKTRLSRDKIGDNRALLVTCSPDQFPKLQKVMDLLRFETVELTG